MSEGFIVIEGSKEEKYKSVLDQLPAIIGLERDLVANMANVAAMLKVQFGWHWAGFYLVKGEDLVLGPFQGPIACTRIPRGKGVCGQAWSSGNTIIVEDVSLFPGHIACSALSKSEIVIPVRSGEEIIAVLDLDSDRVSDFDQTDRHFLEAIVTMIG
jgi:L-methionine (R)-S-oxide reductase